MARRDAQKVINDLAVAHNTEIAGYFFYNAAADMVEDKNGKSVFLGLAKEELNHIRAVKAIADSIKEGAGWIGYEEAVRRGTPSTEKGLPIFQKKNELIERLRTNQTDLNAVSIAIENEDKAIAFYTRLLNDAGSPDEKVVLTKLLEMEKGHLKILRWEIESLNKTGFWGDSMEFSVEMEKD